MHQSHPRHQLESVLSFAKGASMTSQVRLLVLAVVAMLFCVAPRAEAQDSFPFLQGGFTQVLFGNAPGFFGGVAFASNGDVWVDNCTFSASPLTRFVLATTTADGHGGQEHPA